MTGQGGLMKYLLAVVVTLVAAPAFIYSQTPAPAQPRTPVSTAIFVDHDKVAAALAKGGSLVAASDVLVSGSHREKPGQVEVHDKEMDVLYITDGTATFVTGGKIVGAKSTRADQWLGTDITGGTTHKLVKGDVIVVPAGMPHWFKEVPGPLSYYVVKVIKP
jgi:mannose-6-phosphate isomerase-like protein (cupin superfamily)